MRRCCFILAIVLLPSTLRAQAHIVNNGQAYACASGSAGAIIANQQNGQPFNSSGADLIVLTVSWYSAAGDATDVGTPTMTVGATPVANSYMRALPANVQSDLHGLQIFYTHPAATGPNTVFSVAANAPSACVMAVSSGGDEPLEFRAQGSVKTLSATVALPAPLMVNDPNVFAVTAIGLGYTATNEPVQVMVPAYPSFLQIPWIAGFHVGQASAWMGLAGPVGVQPTWILGEPFDSGIRDVPMAVVVFGAANVAQGQVHSVIIGGGIL